MDYINLQQIKSIVKDVEQQNQNIEKRIIKSKEKYNYNTNPREKQDIPNVRQVKPFTNQTYYYEPSNTKQSGVYSKNITRTYSTKNFKPSQTQQSIFSENRFKELKQLQPTKRLNSIEAQFEKLKAKYMKKKQQLKECKHLLQQKENIQQRTNMQTTEKSKSFKRCRNTMDEQAFNKLQSQIQEQKAQLEFKDMVIKEQKINSSLLEQLQDENQTLRDKVNTKGENQLIEKLNSYQKELKNKEYQLEQLQKQYQKVHSQQIFQLNEHKTTVVEKDKLIVELQEQINFMEQKMQEIFQIDTVNQLQEEIIENRTSYQNQINNMKQSYQNELNKLQQVIIEQKNERSASPVKPEKQQIDNIYNQAYYKQIIDNLSQKNQELLVQVQQFINREQNLIFQNNQKIQNLTMVLNDKEEEYRLKEIQYIQKIQEIEAIYIHASNQKSQDTQQNYESYYNSINSKIENYQKNAMVNQFTHCDQQNTDLLAQIAILKEEKGILNNQIKNQQQQFTKQIQNQQNLTNQIQEQLKKNQALESQISLLQQQLMQSSIQQNYIPYQPYATPQRMKNKCIYNKFIDIQVDKVQKQDNYCQYENLQHEKSTQQVVQHNTNNTQTDGYEEEYYIQQIEKLKLQIKKEMSALDQVEDNYVQKIQNIQQQTAINNKQIYELLENFFIHHYMQDLEELIIAKLNLDKDQYDNIIDIINKQ